MRFVLHGCAFRIKCVLGVDKRSLEMPMDSQPAKSLNTQGLQGNLVDPKNNHLGFKKTIGICCFKKWKNKTGFSTPQSAEGVVVGGPTPQEPSPVVTRYGRLLSFHGEGCHGEGCGHLVA